MISDEQQTKMTKWRDSVVEFIESLSPYFDQKSIDFAIDMAKHGEAPIGLSTLAHIALDKDIKLPLEAIMQIQEWCEGFEELPASLEEQAIANSQ